MQSGATGLPSLTRAAWTLCSHCSNLSRMAGAADLDHGDGKRALAGDGFGRRRMAGQVDIGMAAGAPDRAMDRLRKGDCRRMCNESVSPSASVFSSPGVPWQPRHCWSLAEGPLPAPARTSRGVSARRPPRLHRSPTWRTPGARSRRLIGASSPWFPPFRPILFGGHRSHDSHRRRRLAWSATVSPVFSVGQPRERPATGMGKNTCVALGTDCISPLSFDDARPARPSGPASPMRSMASTQYRPAL